jgi:hypothetical protein
MARHMLKIGIKLGPHIVRIINHMTGPVSIQTLLKNMVLSFMFWSCIRLLQERIVAHVITEVINASEWLVFIPL